MQSGLQEKLNDAWKNRFQKTQEIYDSLESFKEEAIRKEDKSAYHTALMLEAQIAHWQSLPANSLQLIYEAIDYFEKLNEYLNLCRSYIIISGFHDAFSNYEKGIDYAQKALHLADENSFEIEMADACASLGQLYLRIQDFTAAEKYIRKAYDLRSLTDDFAAQASSLNMLARVNVLLKEYTGARKFYEEALHIREEHNLRAAIPWTYLGLASLAWAQNDAEEALKLYQKGIDINDEKDRRFKLLCLRDIAEIQLSQNKSEAIELLNEALALTKEMEIKAQEAEVHKLMAEYYEKNKQFAKAYSSLKEFASLREQIVNNESANRLRNQQIAFSTEESRREAEIYQLRNVELKAAFEEIEEKNQHIIDSISYAQRIQRAILPPEKLFRSYLPDSFILYLPKDIVSGDFYWIAEINDSILFTDADCTGHGVPGAFVSIIGKVALDRCINEYELDSPAEILKKLNEILKEVFVHSEDQVKDGMDIALCAYNRERKTLQYSGARNPLYLLRNNELEVIKGDRQSIESSHKPEDFTNHTLQLQDGDCVYIFSDGYIDQFGGPENKKFMQKRLKQLLLDNVERPMTEQEKILKKAFNEWKGSYEQIDDVSLIGVRV
jgi:serine phosphatase RsbU (regulator of sigma subunit)